MPTQTGFWIQVHNGQVNQVWDYLPDPSLVSTEGTWMQAIEVKPDIVGNREIITTHYFDLDSSPPQIVWRKRDLSVEERKEGLRNAAKQKFQKVVNAEIQKEVDEFPETQYDAAVVDAARQVFEARMVQINAASTHEEVDAL